MRLFIAINFTNEVKDYLYKTIMELKQQSVSGNFSQKENMHLTLAFLGEVPDSGIENIESAMDRVNGKGFKIEISGFGNFRNRGEKLYWRGIKENKDLNSLQKSLIDKLKEDNIEFDEKPFKPHITLGRRCIMKTGFSEDDFAANLQTINMDVSSISLMKSRHIHGKLRYSEVYKIQF